MRRRGEGRKRKRIGGLVSVNHKPALSPAILHLFSLDLSKLPGAPNTPWQHPQLLPVRLLLLNTHPTWEWAEPVVCTPSVLALLQNTVKESQEKELLLFVKVYTF